MTVPEPTSLTTLRRAATVRAAVMRLARRLRLEREGEPLSASKLSLMGWLNRSGGMTPSAIAAAERIRPQSLTRLLAALEADGLTCRRGRETDRRQIVIELTEAGRRALYQDMRQRDVWLTLAMKQALSPVEQELLLLAAQLMERLAGAELAEDELAADEEEPS